jgi:ABC-type cobalamin/Fe3+-siderophores transport system ATPase subunit
MGPNGIGKTTLIKTILQVIPPLEGRIMFAGERVEGSAKVNKVRASVGYVPQLHPFGQLAMSVRESVLLSLWGVTFGLFKKPGRDDRARVELILDAMQISAIADRDCRSLSGGQVQRLNIAKALVRNPKVLIFDEPTTYLDVDSKANLALLIHQIKTENPSLAIIMITHEHDFKLQLANREIYLQDGKLIEMSDAYASS